MKKIFRMVMVAVALLSVASAVSFAQGGGGGGGGRGQGRGGGRGVNALFANTSVAADSAFLAKAAAEAAKFQEEMAPIQQAIMAARQGGAQPDSATLAKQAAVTAKRNAALKALLTTDADKKAFDDNVARQAQGRRGGGGR